MCGDGRGRRHCRSGLLSSGSHPLRDFHDGEEELVVATRKKPATAMAAARRPSPHITHRPVEKQRRQQHGGRDGRGRKRRETIELPERHRGRNRRRISNQLTTGT